MQHHGISNCIDQGEADASKEPVAEEHLHASVCKLCDIQDWSVPEFRELAGDIMARNPEHAVQHRKLWEFTQTVKAIKVRGHCHTGAAGLSVAAGTERLLFYLANFVGRIVATDIYGLGEFSSNEADGSFMSVPQRFAPYPYPKERLKVLYMNALELDFPDQTFDFAFSLSSVEHFGGVKEAAAALREMGRVVKPNGTVIVTTECSLNGLKSHDVFLREEIGRLVKESGLHLVQPIYWNVSEESTKYVIDMRKDDLCTLPHINLKSFGAVFTSICLVLSPTPVEQVSKVEVINGEGIDFEQFDTLIAEIGARPPCPPKAYNSLQRYARWLRRKIDTVRYRLRQHAA